MSGHHQRRVSATGQSSPSPSQPILYQHTGNASPTRRVSSKNRTCLTDSHHQLSSRPPISRKISRNNPPQINTDIAKSQLSAMNSRPRTPLRRDSKISDTGSLVNPTSAILQGLIKEQRATRGPRKHASNSAEEVLLHSPPTSQSQSQSEETPSEKQRKVSNALSASLKQPRDMGIREMDQYVSKMNKLNFDLKLEIFHRAQQMAVLEKKLKRMHAMEEELERMQDLEDELEELREVEDNNQRLREANEHLQLELDKRDLAIHEAVELICHLEAKIDEGNSSRGGSQPSTSRHHSHEDLTNIEVELPEVSTPRAQIVVDIPDRTSSKRGASRRPRRAPSFLRDRNRSTAALRSLYTADENKSIRSFSASTMATSVESTDEPESPRLSILSECSYFSPHDAQPAQDGYDQLDRLDQLDFIATDKPVLGDNTLKNGKPNEMMENQIDRINCWIRPREEPPRPSAPRRRARALSDVSRGTQVQILGRDEAFHPTGHSRTFYIESPAQQHVAVFGGRLPPTPDTMSTSRQLAGSGSHVSLAADKGALDQTVPGTPFSMQKRLGRPRSAGDIAKRSNLSISGCSDPAETTMSDATQQAMSIHGRNKVTGLFSSFGPYGRGSAKATWVLGPGSPSNPRLSCYGGDLLFNGEGVEEFVAGMQPNRTPSMKSIVSENLSTHLVSSPPPLSPQEWLEAAKPGRPASRKELNRVEVHLDQDIQETVPHTTERSTVEMSDTPNPEPSSSADEPQLPRNPTLRLRAWANDQQPAPGSPPRRRLSFRPRFFNRSGANSQRQQQDPKSDPVDPGMIPKSGGLVVPKHRRTGSGPNLPSRDLTTPDTDGGNQPASNRAVPRALTELRPSSASRPATSDSAEHRRKGSIFLGWMKGASGLGSQGKDVEPITSDPTAPSRSLTDKAKPSVASAADATWRSGLGLGDAALNSENTAFKLKPVGPTEDEPEWRTRRRSRRMG